MHQYYYELQIYEDLIYGDLEPVRLTGEKIKSIRTYLEEEIGSCQDMQILKLKFRKDDLQVLEKLNITNAHPLANKYFSEQDLAFDNDVEHLLSKKIVNLLNIKLDKVKFTITKAKNSIHQVGICQNSSWNDIDSNRIKYCYYYQVLADCKRKIISSIHLGNYELDEHEFSKLIKIIQKSLMYFINELKKLNEINPELLEYKLKENYTNQDCIAVIYTSLIELLNYLYENHDSEFDKNYPVPYYSEKININQIDEKISVIRKHLKHQSVDPLLIAVMEEQFQRISKFDHPKRLSYHELDYFIEFLNKLAIHLVTFKDQEISTDDVISLLISFKFNNYKFINYLTNEFRKDLKTIDSFIEKSLYLMERKKIVKQSIEGMDIHFAPNSIDISKVICNWIDKEKKVIDAHIEKLKHINEEKPSDSFKMETSLTSKQLAVLIKMLSDDDIFVSNSQSDMARWISANFKTSNKENISIIQSRNNLYSSDPNDIEKIKEIGFALINGCNEKLKSPD
jgi:hypothetical protein